MKLTYEDKLEIYKLRKQGVSWPRAGSNLIDGYFLFPTFTESLGIMLVS